MDSLLDSILESHVVSPGEPATSEKLLAAGFVVVNENGVIYTKTAGRLDVDPASPPYTPDTVSWLASMTKLATAVGILQLVERGIVGIDEDVRSRVPQLASLQVLRGFDEENDGQPILEPNTLPVTVRHLLSHTLAIGVDTACPDLMRWCAATGREARYTDYTVEGITTPLKFAPGEGWYYGTAYDWAGVLLETLLKEDASNHGGSGGQDTTSLGKYLRHNVFEPAGMTGGTTFWPTRDGYGGKLLSRIQQTGCSGGEDSGSWGGKQECKTTTTLGEENDDDIKENNGGVTTTIDLHTLIPDDEHHVLECGGSGLYSTPADYGRLLHAVLLSAIREDPDDKGDGRDSGTDTTAAALPPAPSSLLSRQTADAFLFAPQLNSAQRGILTAIAAWAKDHGFAPELSYHQPHHPQTAHDDDNTNAAADADTATETTAKLDHSLAGLLNTTDVPRRRRAGSLMWSGATNGRWWIDPRSRVAGVMFAHVVPHGNGVAVGMYRELEEVVYRELGLLLDLF